MVSRSEQRSGLIVEGGFASVMSLVPRQYDTEAQRHGLFGFNPEMIDRSCERSSRKT